MSYYSGSHYQPGLVTPMPMGGMGGMPVGGMMPGGGMQYGTPYPGNSLMMSGLGSEYGGPMVEPFAPTIARTPSVYGDRRSLYGDEIYDRDRYYPDGYDRGRRYSSSYYDDDDYRYRRSSSRMSRRSRRRDYDDYDYDREYDYDYDNDRYRDRSSSYYGRSSSYYPSSSSSRYYSSSSRGRRREDMSVVSKRDGTIKVLRNGEERLGDRFRRLLGFDPKGVNVVRLKRGESIATSIRR